MVGKMGEEQKIELINGDSTPHPEYEQTLGVRSKGNYRTGDGWTSRVYLLRPEHGMIKVHSINRTDDIVLDGANDPVKLYRPGVPEPVSLPIMGSEMGFSATLSYSEYLGKYVLLPGALRTWDHKTSGGGFKSGDSHPIYLISPDGAVESLEIPSGKWWPSAVLLTREGLVWTTNEIQSSWRDAGGRLLKDGKATKLFDYLVEGASVSPDGCTLVYATNDRDPKTIEYVRSMNLCASTRK